MPTATSPIQLIYASGSGNTEAVFDKVSAVLTEQGLANYLHRAERTPIDLILKSQYFIMGTSTWEHGAINPFFRELRNAMEGQNLAGKYSGFIGLGDTRYEPILFCKGVDTLRQKFLDNGGKEIHEILKINGAPYDLLDSVIKDWAMEFVYQFKKLTHAGS